MKNHSSCEGVSMVEIETRMMGFQFMNGRKRKLMKWGDIQGVSDCDWNKNKKKKGHSWCKEEEIGQKVGEKSCLPFAFEYEKWVSIACSNMV